MVAEPTMPEFPANRIGGIAKKHKVPIEWLEALLSAFWPLGQQVPPSYRLPQEQGVVAATLELAAIRLAELKLPSSSRVTEVAKQYRVQRSHLLTNTLAREVLRDVTIYPRSMQYHQMRSAVNALLGEIAPKKGLRTESPKSTRQRLVLMSERIEETAELISGLRINSVSEQIDQLRAISKELRGLLPTQRAGTPKLNEAALRSLPVIGKIYDEANTKTAARIIISGSVAGILSLTGADPTIVWTLSMAAFHGPEAFRNALRRVQERWGGNKPSSNDIGHRRRKRSL
jgi:hypothetical protein